MLTAVWSIGLLFFMQLFTLYVESIYRLSLTKLSMGPEMLGVLFILSPLLVLLLGRFGERFVLRIAVAGIIVTRCFAPYLGARAQIVNAGAGVACFLVLLCYTFAGSRGVPRPHWAGAVILAVLGSIILRSSLWSTYDLSFDRVGFPIAVCMFLLVLLWAYFHANGTHRDAPGTVPTGSRTTPASGVQTLSAVLLFFPSFALLYLIASSPGVVSAWSGCCYPAVIVLTTLAWLAAIVVSPRVSPGKGALLLWNVLFIVSLLAGILANRVAFPATPNAPYLIVGADRWWQHAPLYLMLLLSPILAFNVARAFCLPAPGLRTSAMAVFAGGLLILVLPIILVFTNVWAYVPPVSGPLRNQFYLPFLVAGILILLGVALSMGTSATRVEPAQTAWARRVALVLCVIFLGWFGVHQGVLSRVTAVAGGDVKRDLRILTYNYQHGSERNGDECYLGQLRFIEGINADIVFLQESDTPRPSGGNVDSPRLFADALGYYLYFGPKTVTNTFGTAILSRFPLENPRTIYTYSDTDEVGTSMAEIEAGGRRIALFDNHPGGSDAVMHAHADALVAEAKAYEHVIAAGDFNFQQTTPYYAKVTGLLQDSWRSLRANAMGDASTILGGDPSSPNRFDMSDRIDHVFATPSFEASEAQYILTPDSLTDHPAYWCVLRFR